MVSIAICDEDKESINKVKDKLDGILSPGGVRYHLFCLSDGDSLMELLAGDSSGIDMVFLNLSADDGGGMLLAGEIKSHYPHIPIIDASDAESLGSDQVQEHLLKPMAARVRARAQGHITLDETGKSKVLTVMAKGTVHNFVTSDIDYIVSDRRIVVIHEKNGNETAVYAKLDDIEEKIGPCFVRCHQSYLVNMARIKTFDNKKIRLFSDAVIPISQKRRISAREIYFRYLGDDIVS